MPIIHKLFGIEDRESEIFMKKEVFYVNVNLERET